MMKRNYQFLWTMLTIWAMHAPVFGQVNLIRNPSFEDQWRCFNRVGTRVDTVFTNQYWGVPLFQDRTTNNFNTYPALDDTCNLYWRTAYWTDLDTIPTRTGVRFGVFTTTHNWRNSSSNFNVDDQRFYMMTKLKEPLEKNEKYHFEMYIRRNEHHVISSWGVYATNGQGILFTEKPTRYEGTNTAGAVWHQGPIFANGVLIQNRDSVMRDTNWQRVSTCFEAQGKEEFATIGNFLTLASTNRVIVREGQRLGSGEYGYIGYYDVEDLSVFKTRIGIPRDTAICEGDTLVLDVRRNVPVSRVWSDGGGNDSIKRITTAGKYTLYTNYDRNSRGCVQEESINVTVVPKNIGTRAFDTVGCDNKPLTLKAGFGVKDEVVTWQDSTKSPTLKVNKPNRYWANVVNFCVNYTDTFRVKYENCAVSVFAPNAFTPNNDGTNDLFKPYVNQSRNVSVTDYELLVYNRWGDLVFQTKDLTLGWEGKFAGQEAANGVYVWVVKLNVDLNGDPLERVFSGDVSLLR